ncbi:hypothetical protein L249_3172 [Ophiocordyceps polyrhachis-furcata BCC 54312]|uniref:AB hydrolase-1 domain-containing protein n=1 Tax=Ophiocordyceps polyrhachis-furcata BCC 54312 TaxID=1330021 RepID=A0A367LNT5_9HYPO|nr:hypothetical protein L249_3172 [Ophiocordyceps polyrhachis-furcata BCC 54312]
MRTLFGLVFSTLVGSVSLAQEEAGRHHACPTVTSTLSICSTCIRPMCIVAKTVTCPHGCHTPLPTVYTNYPCGMRCPGGCGTFYTYRGWGAMLGRNLLLPFLAGAFGWMPEMPPLSPAVFAIYSEFRLHRGIFEIKGFEFIDGETSDLRLHYWTMGTLRRDYNTRKTTNAVLLLHGTAESGQDFVTENFAHELFAKYKALDARKYFIVIPDAIGHGRSSKPSDGLGTEFPRYRHEDTVNAVRHLLFARLGVNRLRLVLGASGGGLQAWNYATVYAGEVAAVMTLAATPVALSGRDRMWRKTMVAALKSDPAYNNGDYDGQPRKGLRLAISMCLMMTLSPGWFQERARTEQAADSLLKNLVDEELRKVDANDMLYQWESSWRYDIVNSYRKIRAHVNAINTEDDFINPYAARLLDRIMPEVPGATWYTIPVDRGTFGHRSYRNATIWQGHLWDVMGR